MVPNGLLWIPPYKQAIFKNHDMETFSPLMYTYDTRTVYISLLGLLLDFHGRLYGLYLHATVPIIKVPKNPASATDKKDDDDDVDVGD